ncbi:MAG: DMP19 family protein [Anaerolineae bacterium]|nr:DMP19 family protein [Anaerolineae bacterium]
MIAQPLYGEFSEIERVFDADDAYIILLALADMIATKQAQQGLDFAELAAGERMVFYLLWFDTEVANGCLETFFQGEHGSYALEMLAALECIGAVKNYSLFSLALSVFPFSRPAQDSQQRFGQLHAAGDRGQMLLKALDRSYALEAEDALMQGVIYLERHIEVLM